MKTGPTPPSSTPSITSSKLGETAVLSNAQSATATVLQIARRFSNYQRYKIRVYTHFFPL